MNEEQTMELQEMGSLFDSNPDIMIQNDMLGGMSGLGNIGNIITLIAFLLKAWGLYNINKKLGEPYPWLSWIPIIQMYSFVKAGGKKAIWILWIILGTMLVIGGTMLMLFALLGTLYGGGANMSLIGVGVILIILGVIPSIKVIHSISKRTGRGIWTTLGLIFFGAIMYPIVGYKLQDQSSNPDVEAIRPKTPETSKNGEDEL